MMTKREQVMILASFGYQWLSEDLWVKPLGYTILGIEIGQNRWIQKFYSKEVGKEKLITWASLKLDTNRPEDYAESIRAAEHWNIKLDAGTAPDNYSRTQALNSSSSEYVYWVFLNQSD
jgi:hypothetical protein